MLDSSNEIVRKTGENSSDSPSAPGHPHTWGFLTNHFAVLACVAMNSEIRVRDIAMTVGVTERATQGILHDLVEAEYVCRSRVGRRNHYEVRRSAPLRRPPFSEYVTIGDLLEAIAGRLGTSSVVSA